MLRSWKVPPAAGPALWNYLSGGTGAEPSDEAVCRSGYYVQAHGQAWGKGAERLGLESMSQPQFEALAAGRSPHDPGRRLIQTQHGKHVPGYDINVSPPKSLSVELTVASPERRAELLAAHQEAARAAFDYIESNARVVLNRGAAKEQGTKNWREPGELLAYVATHWTSRPSSETERRGSPADPQLHSHLFVMNVAFNAEGKACGVDHRGLLQAGQGAEAIYQLHLSAELSRLGYELDFSCDRRGRRSFELAGSDPGTRAFFSTRHDEVKDLIRQFEIASGRPPTPHEEQELARVGRRHKDGHHGAEPDWDAYLVALERAGLARPEHRCHRHVGSAPLAERRNEVTAELLGPSGLLKDDATCYRRDLAPAVYRAAIGRLSPTEAAEYLARFEASNELVVLRTHHVDASQDLLTTRTQLGRERAIRDTVTERAKAKAPAPDRRSLARALAGASVPLDAEQVAAAEYLARPVGWAALEGWAGTGKTTLAKAVVEAYQASGATSQVVVVSTAAETALRTAAKVSPEAKGYTVEALQRAVDSGRLRLDERTLVVVDEIGMMDSHRAARLVEMCRHSVVRTIGDPRQLECIGAGGWYGEADQVIGHAELTNVHRQKDPADRNMCRDVRLGRSEAALESLRQRGRFVVEVTEAEAVGHLLTDYRTRRDQGLPARDVVVVTDTTNQQIDQLNRLIQDDRRRRGELFGEGLKLTDTANDRTELLAVGDEVTFSRSFYDNRLRISVKNGTRGQVSWIGHDHRVVGVRTHDGRTVKVAVPEYAPEQTLRLAYAGHATRIQGGEAKVCLYLPGAATTDAHSAYSAVTRGTEEIRVYASHELHGLDVAGTLAERWHPGMEKATALSRMVGGLSREQDPQPAPQSRLHQLLAQRKRFATEESLEPDLEEVDAGPVRQDSLVQLLRRPKRFADQAPERDLGIERGLDIGPW